MSFEFVGERRGVELEKYNNNELTDFTWEIIDNRPRITPDAVYLGLPFGPKKDWSNIDIYRGLIEKLCLLWDNWEAHIYMYKYLIKEQHFGQVL